MTAPGSYPFYLQAQRGYLAPSHLEFTAWPSSRSWASSDSEFLRRVDGCPFQRVTCLPPVPAGKTREQVSWAFRIAERAQQGLDSLGLARQDPLEEEGSSQKSLRKKLLQRGSYFLTEGILYRQSKNCNQKFLFTVEEKKKAFWEAHVVDGRHYGSRTTCARLSKNYFWLGVTLDVKKWIKKCKECQDKGLRMAAQSALETRSVAVPQEESKAMVTQDKGLFSFVSLQLFGPLERTPRGARFAFVAVDYFTKWVHAAPMATRSPEETSSRILELVKMFGLPEGIISAQLPGFILQVNKILKMALKLQCNLVVEYNPRTDWFLRNSESYVRRLLSLVLTTNPTDWDQHLHKVFFLQNTHWASDEEEDLSHLEVELQEVASARGEKQPLALAAPETPVGEKDSLGKAQSKDMCLYCNQLSDEGDSDVFAVLQCGRCQAWAHDLCVKRQHGHNNFQKVSFQCRTCLLGEGAAGPGLGP